MPFTEKVGRALRVKRLPFEVVAPVGPEDYARLSPETGMLPVLEVDGHRVPDSSAILDYLDERFPEPPLLSRDARVAREQRRLERWADETIPYYILRWVRSRAGGAAPPPLRGGGFPMATMIERGLIDADGKLHPELFDPGMGGPGPEFENRLDDLEGFLGARPFFYSNAISRADLSVYALLSVLYRDVYDGARALLAARPRLLAHTERVLEETGGAEPV